MTILNITINSFPCKILPTIESKMFKMRLHNTLNYHGHGNISILIVIPIPRSYIHANYKWQILLSRIAREFKINICKQNLTALVKLKKKAKVTKVSSNNKIIYRTWPIDQHLQHLFMNLPFNIKKKTLRYFIKT